MESCDVPTCIQHGSCKAAIKYPGARVPERYTFCYTHYAEAARMNLIVDYVTGQPKRVEVTPLVRPGRLPPMPMVVERTSRPLRLSGPPPAGWSSWSDYTLALVYEHGPLEKTRIAASIGKRSPVGLIERLLRERWLEVDAGRRLSCTTIGRKRALRALGRPVE